MVTIAEFQSLEKRVSVLETRVLLVPNQSDKIVPSKIFIHQALHTEPVLTDRLPIHSYMTHDSNLNHIHVQIFIHGKEVPKPLSRTIHDDNKYYFLFIRSYYTVMIAKYTYSDSPMHIDLNTRNTQNILLYTEENQRHTGMYFGYSNNNNSQDPVPTSNMFTSGRNNGIFFIINDGVLGGNKVANYVKTNPDIDKLNSIAEGRIDIYVSKHLLNMYLDLLDSSNRIIQSYNEPDNTEPKIVRMNMREVTNTAFTLPTTTVVVDQELYIYVHVYSVPLSTPPSQLFSQQNNVACIETTTYKACIVGKYPFKFVDVGDGTYKLTNDNLALLYFMSRVKKHPGNFGIPRPVSLPSEDGIYFLINIPAYTKATSINEVKALDKVTVLISPSLKDFYSWTWIK